MSNLNILIDYGTQMVNVTNKGGNTIVGLIGANLTHKEVKVAIKKIAKKANKQFTVSSIVLEQAITLKMDA